MARSNGEELGEENILRSGELSSVVGEPTESLPVDNGDGGKVSGLSVLLSAPVALLVILLMRLIALAGRRRLPAAAIFRTPSGSCEAEIGTTVRRSSSSSTGGTAVVLLPSFRECLLGDDGEENEEEEGLAWSIDGNALIIKGDVGDDGRLLTDISGDDGDNLHDSDDNS